MSLRSLMLRAQEHRTAEENECVEAICKIFRVCSKDKKRIGKDIAHLLVNDWCFLKMTRLDAKKPATSAPWDFPSSQVLSRSADAGFSLEGRPLLFPSSGLSYHSYPSHLKFDGDQDARKKRRLSLGKKGETSIDVVNIVDDN
jgi:hypothetical protein